VVVEVSQKACSIAKSLSQNYQAIENES
jgi:hypothetical protein